MVKSVLTVRGNAEAKRITAFIRRVTLKSGADGLVIALSGGVDSSVVGALCVRALGKEKVLGVLMPSDHTPKRDMEDATRLVNMWGIRSITVPISPIVELLISAAGPVNVKLARANVQARVRMTVLYYLANSRNLLVAGTGDRSEELLGYFTKHGDGGVDLLPIAHLYKTQVRLLGEHLGLPPEICSKPSSPQLWPGQTAEEELPASYEKLDLFMHYLFDVETSAAIASGKAGVSRAVAKKILRMHAKTAHKRELPLSLVKSSYRLTP